MSRRKRVDPVKEAAKLIGSLGGRARAKNLPAARREEIAKKGAAARWKGKKKGRPR